MLPEEAFPSINLPMAPPRLTSGAWHGCAAIPECLRGACLCPLAGAATGRRRGWDTLVPAWAGSAWGRVGLTLSKCQSKALHRFILIQRNV